MILKVLLTGYLGGGVAVHRGFRYDREMDTRTERIAVILVTIVAWPALLVGAVLAGPETPFPEPDVDEEWAKLVEDLEWP